MREEQIVYLVGDYWVAAADGQYTVYRNGNVVAYADSSYAGDADGLSLARARVDYLTQMRRSEQVGRRD